MKKILLLATAAILSTSVNAGDVSVESNDLKLQLLGRFNFQSGYLKQSHQKGITSNVSPYREHFAFNSNAFTAARISAENEDMKYGAQLSLFTSARQTGSPAYDRSHIFVETNYGKIEAGSNFSVSAKMAITALDIASATGDDSSSYIANVVNYGDVDAAYPGEIVAPLYPTFFLDSENLDKFNGESSRKISYYSPELNGFRVGVSYIPDSGNLGNSTLKDESDNYNKPIEYRLATMNLVGATVPGTTEQTTFSQKRAVKDAIALGVSFSTNISDMTSMKISLTSEHGTAANKGTKTVVTNVPAVGTTPASSSTVTTKYNLSKLQTYNIGTIFTYGNYSIAGSYADLGKSMTSNEIFGKKRSTKFYTLGGAYNQGPLGFSVVYSKANQFGNKMDIYTVGTDYKLAPGFLPYVEVARFNGKAGLPAVYNNKSVERKFRGYVVIAGAKIMF